MKTPLRISLTTVSCILFTNIFYLFVDATAAQDFDEQGSEWKYSQNIANTARFSSTNKDGLNIQNTGKIKFSPPRVPVIFVLGGPGSGKVTHCDTLMQEKHGVVHINIMDLLQQYTMGNGKCFEN